MSVTMAPRTGLQILEDVAHLLTDRPRGHDLVIDGILADAIADTLPVALDCVRAVLLMSDLGAFEGRPGARHAPAVPVEPVEPASARARPTLAVDNTRDGRRVVVPIAPGGTTA